MVQFFTLGGERRREEFSGYSARIIQHEVDHLEGVLFTDRMKPEELQQYQDRLDRYTAQFVPTPPV
jgi:peptide deformylase